MKGLGSFKQAKQVLKDAQKDIDQGRKQQGKQQNPKQGKGK